ncbi:hypothetical protein DENSPDRAFT_833009 [Dentipellis sp. KUC8613]|nr:hypothetical protein DENSPDRAFT_833009 [Dentipellis sp. KUC8613]
MDKDKNPEQPPKQRRRPGRVPVSCAECRRLKLRCDRKVPCETCTKRGCASVCPNGTLTSGRTTNRYVLANTEELHSKIAQLSTRVRDLEDALYALQSTVHPGVQHTLLKPELTLSHQPSPPAPAPVSAPASASNGCSSSESPEMDEDEGVVDAFGTMSLGSKGTAKFFGSTARCEFLMQAYNPSPGTSFYTVTRLDERLLDVPFPEAEREEVDEELRRLVWSYVPPLSEACNLCELFLHKSQLIFTSVTRTQLFDEIVDSVYRSPSLGGIRCAHALALLYIIFAIAKLCDLSSPNYQIEAHEFFLLSRAALTLEPPIRHTTSFAVQTLTFMAQYLDISASNSTPAGPGKAWLYLGIAVKMAHSMGLHLKGARWKLDEEESQRRSRVFWHVFSVDTWCGFGFGRPPSTNLAFVDCDMPVDQEEHTTADGKKEIGYHRWNSLFSRLAYQVMVTVFGAQTPQYMVIMDVDRQIREFATPEYLRLGLENESRPDSTPEMTCQRWIVYSYKEWTLLNIHRAYFAVALREKPNELLKHKYGPSVMAVYRAAYRTVEGAEIAARHIHGMLFRTDFQCSRILSASIVVCLLVCSAPSSELAPACLDVLDRACGFFEHAASRGNNSASENLDFVQNLRRQGHEAMDKTRDQLGSSMSATELERLGGMTHLIQPLGPSISDVCRSSRNMTTTTPNSGTLDPGSPQSFGVLPASPYSFFDSSPQYQQTAAPPQPSASQSMDVPLSNFLTQPNMFSGQQPDAVSSNGQTPAPYILDATWQDFVQQLGF